MDLHTLTWISHSLQALRLVPLAAGWVHFRSDRFAREPWLKWLWTYLLLDAILEVVLLGMALRGIRTYGLLDLAIVPSFVLQALVLVNMRKGVRLKAPLALVGTVLVLLSAWEGWRGGLYPKWAGAMILSGLAVLGASLWLAFQALSDDRAEPLFQRPSFWLTGTWIIEQGSAMLLTAGTGLFLRTLSPRWIGLPWITHDLVCAALAFSMARTFLCPKPRSS